MRLLLVLALYSISYAATIPISSYNITNPPSSYRDTTYNGYGQPNGPASFLTWGTGKLTDGLTGSNDLNADLGNGPGFEWVGSFERFWPITIHLVDVWRLDTLRLYTNDSRVNSVARFRQAQVRFSMDLDPTGPYETVYQITALPPASTGFIDIPLGGRLAKTLQVSLTSYGNDGPYYFDWTTRQYVGNQYTSVFLSEIQLEGSSIAEPQTCLLIISALSALALLRR